MKQKRFGLIVANILPILIVIGEVALIVNYLAGLAIIVSIAVTVVSVVAFYRLPYGEEAIFLIANVGYTLAIVASWLSCFVEPSIAGDIGLLLGFATVLAQGVLTVHRIQGRL